MVGMATKTGEWDYKQTCELYLLWGQMKLCVGSARGKHFNQWSLLKFTWLLSTLFWYCLVQNENMQRHPQTSPWNTHMKGKTGGKTNCETFFMKSYRNNLTTYITERMSNSVQYAHLVGRGTKLKMSHCWGLMQICLLQKLFKLAVLMYK